MTKLGCLLVVDPSAAAADRIAQNAKRVAKQCRVATTIDDTCSIVEQCQPDLVVFSLQFGCTRILELAKAWKKHAQMLVVATYAEMTPEVLSRLKKAGITELLPQPIRLDDLFGIVSRHF